MTQNIASVGMRIPGTETKYIAFQSKSSLHDYDIIIINPDMHSFNKFRIYKNEGRIYLHETSTLQLKEHFKHWTKEIHSALKANKNIFIYLNKKEEVDIWVHWKRVTHTLSNYKGIVPAGIQIGNADGSRMVIPENNNELASYWKEVGHASEFRVLLEGANIKPTVLNKDKTKVVGARIRFKDLRGNLFLMPYINFNNEKYKKINRTNDQHCWNEEACIFGKKLINSLCSLDEAIKSFDKLSPPPEWASKDKVMKPPPKCFISYSHDSDAHKTWVSNLYARLRKDGVDAILDQWDLRLGGELANFIESSASKTTNRVICICSEAYVTKANNGIDGVGYEKAILTAELMKNVTSEKVIPLIRNNNSQELTPAFLSSKRYIDFRNDDAFETLYLNLILEVHGQSSKARPALGPNPFENLESPIASTVALSPGKYSNSNFAGTVEFDYDRNNGVFAIGSGNIQFDLKFSSSGNGSIHTYSDSKNIEGIAIARRAKSFKDIKDALAVEFYYDSRTAYLKAGEIFTLVNKNGFFAAVKILEAKARSHGAIRSLVKFEYVINQRKEADFTSV